MSNVCIYSLLHLSKLYAPSLASFPGPLSFSPYPVPLLDHTTSNEEGEGPRNKAIYPGHVGRGKKGSGICNFEFVYMCSGVYVNIIRLVVLK